MTAARTATGRFGPGSSGNPAGRPTNEQRVRQAIERTLLDAGATPEDIERLVRAAGNPLQAALAICVLAATVAEQREQNTPSSVRSHAEASPAR